jgi:4-hydroxy-4-methyl-2-oxoglutarate aldolase
MASTGADDETLELVDRVSSAALVDAMGRFHRHRCHILDLVSPTPGRVLFGPAVTISFFPACSASADPDKFNFADLFYEAVGAEPAGKVLVLASNGYPETSLGGATKLSRVENHKLAGLLADGRLRDFRQLGNYRFATYCRGETTRWGGDTVTPFQANVPVVLGGVGILPGHYIYADAGGAVVIPADEIERVFKEAEQIEADDVGYLKTIRAERLPSSQKSPARLGSIVGQGGSRRTN